MGATDATDATRDTMNHPAKTRSRLQPPETLSGDALWKALGFNNIRAFQRARASGQLDLPLYPKPGTRGVYALTRDVEQYRARQNALDDKKTS